LLVRYPDLVRQTIARFEGEEIRTEGDSFYVVFEAVSQAVRAGLAIVEGAANVSQEIPERPPATRLGFLPGPWAIGLDLPLSGPEAAEGDRGASTRSSEPWAVR
jgi:class 3 adenylate cyclase